MHCPLLSSFKKELEADSQFGPEGTSMLIVVAFFVLQVIVFNEGIVNLYFGNFVILYHFYSIDSSTIDKISDFPHIYELWFYAPYVHFY